MLGQVYYSELLAATTSTPAGHTEHSVLLW